MSYVISKSFEFSASHQLRDLPATHQCARLHGHNYRVVLDLTCRDDELSEIGFVRDFADLAGFIDYVRQSFDHRHLNNVIEFNPTAENLARYLYDAARLLFGDQVAAVTVWETPTSCARYSGYLP